MVLGEQTETPWPNPYLYIHSYLDFKQRPENVEVKGEEVKTLANLRTQHKNLTV